MSFPSALVSPLTPAGATFDCQSSPRRLGHRRRQVLGEGPVLLDVGAGLHVEDVGAAVRPQGRRQRRLPVGDRDELVVDLDVGELLVERGDVAVGGRRVGGRPAPPVHGARRRGPDSLVPTFLLAALAAAAYGPPQAPSVRARAAEASTASDRRCAFGRSVKFILRSSSICGRRRQRPDTSSGRYSSTSQIEHAAPSLQGPFSTVPVDGDRRRPRTC